MNNVLPRNTLLTIYKSFLRPHLDYGDILYHQPNNESVNSELESVQYTAVLAITGTIKGTSRSRLYKELGLESLKTRSTFRHLCSFHKIISTGRPTYLFILIPNPLMFIKLELREIFPHVNLGLILSKIPSFLWTIVKWNKIHPETQNASLTVFKKHLLKGIRLVPHSAYNICNPNDPKLLTR